MKEKAIIVLSGGMDSGVLLADQVDKVNVVAALFFYYGSKHNDKEMACAELLANRYGVELKKIKLPFINELFNSSLLSNSDEEIPEGHYQEENMKSTVVPFRNGIMLAIAAGLAESLDADLLLIGSHAGDHAIYPDCRPEFNTAMTEAISIGTYNGVRVEAPYSAISKSDIARIGYRLGFEFKHTWTCYKGGDLHCGKCGSCVERHEALSCDGHQDPTNYTI
jgi:7-cyano-7-deazaguanine synthase